MDKPNNQQVQDDLALQMAEGVASILFSGGSNSDLVYKSMSYIFHVLDLSDREVTAVLISTVGRLLADVVPAKVRTPDFFAKLAATWQSISTAQKEQQAHDKKESRALLAAPSRRKGQR